MSENEIPTIQLKKYRRNPLEKEQQIYTFLRQKKEEGFETVSFHQLQNNLHLSPGALQATIIRCLKPDAQYRIYEVSGYSDKNKRITRIFSLKPIENSPPPISNLKSLLDKLQNIEKGEPFEFEDTTVLPLKIDKQTVQFLLTIPKVDPNTPSLKDLFEKAITFYLQKVMSPKLRKDVLDYLHSHPITSTKSGDSSAK